MNCWHRLGVGPYPDDIALGGVMGYELPLE